MISEACIRCYHSPVLFQLISRPSADDSSFMSSKAKMRTSNISAITDVVSKVQICEHFLTQAHTYETSVNGTTAVYY